MNDDLFQDEESDKRTFDELKTILLSEKIILQENFDLLYAEAGMDPRNFLVMQGELSEIANKMAIAKLALEIMEDVNHIDYVLAEIETSALDGLYDLDEGGTPSGRPFRHELIRQGLLYFRGLCIQAGKAAVASSKGN